MHFSYPGIESLEGIEDPTLIIIDGVSLKHSIEIV
jgi:hypothetical protein